jgi:alpha,alpha-trehalase
VRDDLATLAGRLPLGFVSGRALTDLRARVGLPGVWYAGSHGFELCTPDGTFEAPYPAFLPRLARIEGRLRRRLADIAGVRVERKPYAVAVHDRAVPDCGQEVQVRVAEAVDRARRLRALPGKAVIDVLPDVVWGKGQAVRWMLAACGNPVPLYAGDDTTDEDAFAALADGITVLVANTGRPTAARYRIGGVAALHAFLDNLANRHDGANRRC